MLLPPVEEGEVAHGGMPSYAETGSFDANLAVEGEDTAQDYEANGRFLGWSSRAGRRY